LDVKHYSGSVIIHETMSLDDVAIELNRFLSPVELIETDRFDEVPGFVADVSDSVEFVLQGTPFDLPPYAPASDRYNYFHFSCSDQDIGVLPASLRGLPLDAGVGKNGYCDVNEYLYEQLSRQTRLVCERDL
jgi:hypothetical protein